MSESSLPHQTGTLRRSQGLAQRPALTQSAHSRGPCLCPSSHTRAPLLPQVPTWSTQHCSWSPSPPGSVLFMDLSPCPIVCHQFTLLTSVLLPLPSGPQPDPCPVPVSLTISELSMPSFYFSTRFHFLLLSSSHCPFLFLSFSPLLGKTYYKPTLSENFCK